MDDVACTKPLMRLAGELMRKAQLCEDVDGDVLQNLMVKHGLLCEEPATAEDCEQEWAQEYDIRPGDNDLQADRPRPGRPCRRAR